VWDYWYYYAQPAGVGRLRAPVAAVVTFIAPPAASLSVSGLDGSLRPSPAVSPVTITSSSPSSGRKASYGHGDLPASGLSPRPATSLPVTAGPPLHAVAGASRINGVPRQSAGISLEHSNGEPGARTRQSTSPTESAPVTGAQASPMGWMIWAPLPVAPGQPMPILQQPDPRQGDSGQSSGSLSSESSPDTPPSNDSEGLSLSLVPERPVVSSGETFSVEVVLTEARGITSVPFHLRFDP